MSMLPHRSRRSPSFSATLGILQLLTYAYAILAAVPGVARSQDASASLITYYFRGSLNDPFGALPAGTPFCGSFTYDGDQPLNTPLDSYRGDYHYTSVSVTIADGTVTDNGTGFLHVYDQPYPTDMLFLYTVNVSGTFGGLTLAPAAGIQVVLQNVAGTVWSTPAIPPAGLTLSDFTTGNATFLELRSEDPSFVLARGELTDLSSTPFGSCAPCPGPTAVVTASVGVDGLLSICGTAANDEVVFRLKAGDPNVIEVDDQTNGAGADFAFPLAGITSIRVRTYEGDDLVAFHDVNGGVGTVRPVDSDGGPGDNTFIGATGDLSVQEVIDRLAIVATAADLIDDVNALVARMNNEIIPAAAALVVNANDTVYVPANALVDQADADLVGPANDLITRANDEIGAEADALIDTANTELGAARDALVAEANALFAQAEAFMAHVQTDVMQNDAAQFEIRLDDLIQEALAVQDDEEALQAVIDCIEREIDDFGARTNADLAYADTVLLAAAEELVNGLGEDLRLAVENFTAQAGQLNLNADLLGDDAEALQATAEGFALQADDLAAAADGITAQADSLALLVEDLTAQADGIVAQLEDILTQGEALMEHESVADAGRDGAPVAVASTCLPISPAPTVVAVNFWYASGTKLNDSMTCPSSTPLCVLVGRGGSDELVGSPAGVNLIFGDLWVEPQFPGSGFPGNDILTGGNGFDILVGDAGGDCLRGQAGTDLMVGDLRPFNNDPPGGDDMEGNEGIDILLGDDLAAVGGDDIMHGNEDIDAMWGGPGDDIMHGESGRNFTFTIGSANVSIDVGNLMIGQANDDEMHGGTMMDMMLGQSGDDKMYGDDGIDIMIGGDGGDAPMEGNAGGGISINSVTIPLGNLMWGNDDNDVMYGGVDADLMVGGDHNDEMHGDAGPIDVIIGSPGIDTMYGDDGIDWMFGRAGADIMHGGDGLFDFMLGDDDGDTMYGEDGIDWMFGRDGADTMYGGDGLFDLIVGGEDDDNMHGEDGVDLMWGVRGEDTMFGDGGFVDLMSGGDDDDTMFGGTGFDLMWGRDCDDAMYGEEGTDVMNGGDDDDTMQGNGGIDFMFGDGVSGFGDDTMNGNADLDLILGQGGDDLIHGDGGVPFDILSGGSGDDRILGDADPDVMLGDSGRDYMEGGDDVDVMIGGDQSDTMYGNDGFDAMFGWAGGDCMHGGEGPDFIAGMSGDDAINGDGNSTWVDFLLGGGGNDEVHGDAGVDWVCGNHGDDRVFGDGDKDWVEGNDGDDKVYGGDGNDIVYGDGLLFGGGNDLLFGDDGGDWLAGDAQFGIGGDDRLFGGSGDDHTRGDCFVWCAGGNDTVFGDAGNDRMWGGRHADDLDGGAGNDRLFGDPPLSAGDDRLLGGAGVDFLAAGWGDDTLDGGLDGGDFLLAFDLCPGYVDNLYRCPAGTDILIYNLLCDSVHDYCSGVGFSPGCFGEIHGIKWNDVSANGVREPGDLGLGGVTIKLNGAPVATTAPDNGAACLENVGEYSWSGLCPGTYTVSEVQPSGMFETAPFYQGGGAGPSVTLTTPGQIVTGVDFGNAENCSPNLTGTACRPAECPYVCASGNAGVSCGRCSTNPTFPCDTSADCAPPGPGGTCAASNAACGQCSNDSQRSCTGNFECPPRPGICSNADIPCVNTANCPSGGVCGGPGICNPGVCESEQCIAGCARVDEAGVATLIDCGCAAQNRCHIVIPSNTNCISPGNPYPCCTGPGTGTCSSPFCTGNCEAGEECSETITPGPLPESFDICCACKEGCASARREPQDCPSPSEILTPTVLAITRTCGGVPEAAPCVTDGDCPQADCLYAAAVVEVECISPSDCQVANDPVSGPYCLGGCADNQLCQLNVSGNEYGCGCLSGDCAVTAAGTGCTPVTCPDPSEVCTPTLAIHDAGTGQTAVLQCECADPSACRLEIDPVEGPYCVGTCDEGSGCNLLEVDGVLLCGCAADECHPTCVNYDPGTQVTSPADCHCAEPDECYVTIPEPGAGPPTCAGGCPSGTHCTQTETVNPDGTIRTCCECGSGPEPGGVYMNRFLGLVVPPSVAGQQTALRVTLTTLNHPRLCCAGRDGNGFGTGCNLNAPCDTDANCSGGTPLCRHQLAPGTPNFSSQEGNVRYVNSFTGGSLICADAGPPFNTTYRCATLGCDPEYRDWATDLGVAVNPPAASGVLYVTGDAVVPNSTLHIEMIAASCGAAPGANTCTAASTPFAVGTSRWGDITSPGFGPPDGKADVLDIPAVVNKLKGVPTFFGEYRTWLKQRDPAANTDAITVVDLSDVQDGVLGKPYPAGRAIDACPND